MNVDFICMLIKSYIEIMYLDIQCEPKKIRRKAIFYLYFVIITFIFYKIMRIYKPTATISTILTILIILSYSFFYKDKISRKILYSIILIVLIAVSELVSGFILLSSEVSMTTFGSNSVYSTIQIFLTCLFMLISVSIIRYVKFKDFSIKKNVLLCFYPVTSIVILYSLYWIIISKDYNPSYYVVFISISLLVLLSNFVIIYLIKSVLKSELITQRNSFSEEYQAMITQHQNDIISLNEKTKKIRHDLKAGLMYISGLIKAKKYDDCVALLDELLGITANLENIVNTGYNGLDAVLSSKIITAKSKGIEVCLSLVLPSKENIVIDEYDISLICANVLDNAIEATEKCSNENLCINLQIFFDSILSTIKIICQNPTVNKNIINRTSKKDQENHGYGLEIIMELSKKWHGMVQTNIHEKKFTIIISLYNSVQQIKSKNKTNKL